jgi:hypothetical protein
MNNGTNKDWDEKKRIRITSNMKGYYLGHQEILVERNIK